MKVTTSTLQCMKKKGQKIVALTAYDATFARLIDASGADVILVGDSLGMVIQGFSNTLPVTIEDMIYHTKAVQRTSPHAHVVVDMPFMSYQTSVSDAIANAGKIIKDGGGEAVKIEGGLESVECVKALVSAGIPVMAHIGLKPQHLHRNGGYKIHGRTLSQSEELLKEARAMEDAGAYSLLLEGVALETAREITESIAIPTIGIGSGPYCDGQILVIYDLLGMDEEFQPKFLKKYSDLAFIIKNAVRNYSDDVKNSRFPTEEHAFHR